MLSSPVKSNASHLTASIPPLTLAQQNRALSKFSQALKRADVALDNITALRQNPHLSKSEREETERYTSTTALEPIPSYAEQKKKQLEKMMTI